MHGRVQKTIVTIMIAQQVFLFKAAVLNPFFALETFIFIMFREPSWYVNGHRAPVHEQNGTTSKQIVVTYGVLVESLKGLQGRPGFLKAHFDKCCFIKTRYGDVINGFVQQI